MSPGPDPRRASLGDMPLPRGRHRLPREVVTEVQRARLLAACAAEVARKGYSSVVVQDIIAAAGVSRTTFYANFENKLECVRAAHEVAFERLNGVVYRACAEQAEWPLRLAAATRAAVRFAAESPAEAQLLVFDTVGAEPAMAARVRAANEHLVGLLRAGREHSPAAAEMPPQLERALIGGVGAIVAGRLANGEAARLPELEPELVEMMLFPYVGAAEARRLAAA